MRHHPLLSALALGALLLALTACGPSAQTLEIHVQDAAGDTPVAAQVALGGRELTAKSAGRYEATVEPGDYALVISAAGYVTARSAVTVAKDQAPEPLSVALEPRRLEGLVRDAVTDAPVADVTLVLGAASAQSGADGAYSLPARESTSLSATARGYLAREWAAAELDALFSIDGVQLAPLELELEPRMLAGRVTESGSDAPLAGIRVSVGAVTAETDADGRYELRYVEPGESLVVVSAAHRPLDPIIYDGVGEQLFGLTPWQVAVSVTDAATGAALAGESVSAGEDAVTTGATGAATLRATPPVSVTVTADGYAPQSLAYVGQESWAVALEPARLEVLVRDQASAAPLPDAPVQLLGVDGATTLLRTDEDGRLTIEDADGLSELRVKAVGHWLTTVPITRAGALTVEVAPLEARGIYVPFGLLAVPDYVASLLDLVDATDLNTVVIDVKSDKGYLAWESAVPLAVEIGAYQGATSGVKLMDIRALVEECHARGIYAIARLVVFKDDVLAQARPEYAVTKQSGGLYVDYANQNWVDPFRQEVRDYNAALALEAAGLGFDEVQFDYVRFPTEGPLSLIRVYSQEDTTEGRVGAVTAYLKQAYEALSPTHAFVSADIFGLNVWVKAPADNNVGQRLEDLAPYVDYVSPMLYPATFWSGNLGFANPAEYPYLIPYLGTAKSRERAPHVAVRPWLQYYSWGEPAYDTFDYMLERRGAEDAKGNGWLFWNAKGKYQAEVFDPELYAQYEADLVKAIEAERAAAEKE
ncbi:MAG: hypothetical protein GX557_10375 [Chloroflexi bacterium]|nr:hypothetical protein [Chloroflexota bacterium]